MFLRGMKVKRNRIPVDISSVKLEEGEKERLLAKIKESNDPASKERLILGFIRLAIDIAARYASKFPKQSEVLLSGSLYGLAWAVDKIQEKLEDDGVERWITACCHRFVYQALQEEGRFRIGSRMCKQPISVLSGLRTFDFKWSSRFVSRLSVLEVREIMDEIVRDETDKSILRMRLEGHKNVEIADQLGLTKKQVCIRRSRMKRRYIRCRDE